jgi:hypothetical protein
MKHLLFWQRSRQRDLEIASYSRCLREVHQFLALNKFLPFAMDVELHQ